MALINLFQINLAFGGPKLADEVSFRVLPGERVCLLGRNGVGKSSFLKLLAGLTPPDSGDIARAPDLVCGYLPQDVPPGLSGEVYRAAAGGLGKTGELLCRFRDGRAGDEAEKHGNDQELWEADRQLQTVLSKLGLDPCAETSTMSGGQMRRVMLARALAGQPGLLLLDEPTNHLDIDTIVWLEDFLLKREGAMVFVSHDRALAKNLATRVVEMDRGRLFDWNCSYDEFLLRRAEALQKEQEQWDKADKKQAAEEQWLHGGIKARRTRNEGRVRRLMEMRAERTKRREVLGQVRMKSQQAGISGKLVAELEEVGFAYGDKPIIEDMTATILRGDKVGIIGPNGSGKTTLLRLILGQLAPKGGSIRLGVNLAVAYFDQMRAELDPEKTVRDNLSDGHDTLLVGGIQRHVISYLKDFLFTPDRANSPVAILSGGERNRLLLAKLFAKPANLLVLDEPTNDLDADTLELLEDLLVEFAGTVLVVSHDRAFLNNVVTSTMALEGGGRVTEYAGGYDDWLAQRKGNRADSAPAKPKAPKREKPPQAKKLSFKEKRELEALPAKIEELEQERGRWQEKLSDPQFYVTAGAEVSQTTARLDKLEGEIEEAMARWMELEELAG